MTTGLAKKEFRFLNQFAEVVNEGLETQDDQYNPEMDWDQYVESVKIHRKSSAHEEAALGKISDIATYLETGYPTPVQDAEQPILYSDGGTYQDI